MPLLDDDGSTHHETMGNHHESDWGSLHHTSGRRAHLGHREELLGLFAQALVATRQYLQAMGARVAPSKSYNFANAKQTTRWLQETWWSNIEANIEVVKDFRYLGAHLTSGSHEPHHLEEMGQGIAAT